MHTAGLSVIAAVPSGAVIFNNQDDTTHLKFFVISAMRAIGLLRVADRCNFWIGLVKACPRNRRFRVQFPDFATPPPHLAFDALNHVDWTQYRESGLRHAALFAKIIREEIPAPAPIDVLEWGCGPGRLIRHMPALLSVRLHALSGTDYNGESIAWCRRHFPGIDFAENGLNPPLPFPDGRFDVVYSFSVFTHLSEAVQIAWARELHRVLKPGGLLVSTTHGAAYRYLLTSNAERERYDTGHLVVQGNYQEGKKWFFAVHPEAFVRERLLADFPEIRRYQIGPDDDILQDVWIARKAAAALPADE